MMQSYYPLMVSVLGRKPAPMSCDRCSRLDGMDKHRRTWPPRLVALAKILTERVRWSA